jgi:two-component system, chemotaxis family, protein-glutamate methylesterase/glutaminase
VTPQGALLPGEAPSRRSLTEAPIRLMIVDDSTVARAVLARMIAAHPGFEIVATAASAREALDILARTPVDIILLDIEMPGETGLQALPALLRAGKGARVLVVSSQCEQGAEASVRALAPGAIDTLPKPGTGAFGGRFSHVLAERLHRIGRVSLLDRGAAAERQRPLPLRDMPDWKIGCIAVGASTGGLHALNAFLQALPRRVGTPILVTQHLPTLFMPYFTRQLEASAGRRAKVAEDGDLLIPEQIMVSPGDAHIRLERRGSHEPIFDTPILRRAAGR